MMGQFNDVIVADNDGLIRDILRSLLLQCGFSVLTAGDGEEAVAFALKTTARAVILDQRMPRLDGCGACAEIRRLPGYAAVPILMLTAFGDDATRLAAQYAGASRFLTKPFTPMELMQALAVSLGLHPPGGVSGPSPTARIWAPRQEPRPLFGEPVELVKGLRTLKLCRR